MAATTESRRILLREMTSADLDRVREIEIAAYVDAWPATAFESELRNAFATYVVAVELGPHEPVEPGPPRPRPWPLRWLPPRTPPAPGRIAGFCGMWFHVDQLHIVTIAVDPTDQGRGIAQRLLLDALQRAADAELRNAALEVRESNARARAIYERFGFRPTGRLRGYYTNNREDALVMLTGDLASPEMRERLAALRAEHARRFQDTEWLEPRAAAVASSGA